MDAERIKALLQAREGQRDAARPEVVTRLHADGKMTARERVFALLDPDSAVEYGSIAAQTAEGDWIAEAGGVDFVGSIDGHPVVASSTDYTDHGGGYGAGRLSRLFSLAHEQRWPVVLFVDGGGSRARHPRAGLGHIETTGPIGRLNLLEGVAELSGWAPTVAIVSGPSFAGHASLAGFSDFVIATRGSSIGMGGPPMVEAALGKQLSASELAGVEMHDTAGGIDLLVDSESEAIAAARQYLSYCHDLAGGKASSVDLDSLAPDAETYDMRPILRALCDEDSLFELRPNFATSLITTLARIDGQTVGVLANQPQVHGGAIDVPAASKISRFVELCNAYEYPMLAVIDTPGCVATWQSKGEPAVTEPGLTRGHARALMAHQQRTVPLMSIQIRRGRGLGAALMNGVGSTRGVSALKLAWPGVELGHRDGFSTVTDHNAFDDVIAPGETRERLVRMLHYLNRPPPRTTKKHPIDSW